jgi:electron transfer flavoprotein alpha subunit
MRKRKNLYFDEATVQFVEQYKNSNHLPSFTSALGSIIDEYRHSHDIPATELIVHELAKQVAHELKDALSDTLTRIRLGTNNADRNSDIIILLLNTLLGYQQYTSLIKDDTPQLAEAKKIEKERIAEFRQRKLNRAGVKSNTKEKGLSSVLPAQKDSERAEITEDDLII